MNTPPLSLRASEFIVNPSSSESLMAKLDNAFRSKYTDSRWGSAREIIFSDKNSADFIRWILTETVLSRINVIVESDSVTADYTMLAKYIDSHKDAALMRCLDDNIAALCKIDKWTAFSAEKKGAHTVLISLRASKSKGN